MFDTLTSMFKRKRITTEHLERKSILTIKLKEQILMYHFSKEAESPGAELSENEVICCLLLSLPEFYSNFLAILEALQEEKLELGLVKAWLLDEERKKKETLRQPENVASMLRTRNSHLIVGYEVS